MIPILYTSTESNFLHNGIGALADALSCKVTEARNGAFEAEFTYPIEGRLYPYIAEDCIIKAKPNDTSAPQLFRIYKSSKPTDGVVTYYAEHISYTLNGNPVEEISIKNANAQTALSNILAAGLYEHPFTAQSDIDTLNSTSISLATIRSALGGIQGSMLDVWGGEYEFDNFVIKLHRARGLDAGVKIAYGKNLTSIKQEKSISEVYTAVYPYAKYTPTDEDGQAEQPEEITVTLSEKVLYSPYVNNYARVRVLMKDFTEVFGEGEEITEAALRAKATSWVNNSGFDIPSVNIAVSFKHLWQSPEYEKYAPLERVGLCDTVTVVFDKLGIQATAKVIKTVYDALKEQYETIEIGNARSNFADTINEQTNTIEGVKHEIKKQSTAANVKLAEAIARATAAITGQSGGYVVLNPSNNPQEILIMDEPTIEDTVNIWRWNSGGLGHSNSGYNGPYELAITNDGVIVADFITAGTLKGELLEAGSVRTNAISQGYKTEVTDEITGAKNEVEQAFVAADDQLRSFIQNVSETLSGDISQTETQISELLQTVENLSLSFTNQYTGGINCISNSSGLNGVSSDWHYTGTVQTLQNTDTKNNTLSSSCFWVGAGTLSQEVATIAGSTYTLTFKMKKSAVRGTVKIIVGGSEIEVVNTADAEEWTEHTTTFIVPSNALTVEIYSYADYLYIADIMLTEGSAKQRWTPAPNEIYTTDVKIDRRGIHITNTESETSTIINNVEFAVLHKETKVITVNKDTTILKKTVVEDELTVGKLKIVPVAGGVDEILLD
jgi:phage minor structural protein